MERDRTQPVECIARFVAAARLIDGVSLLRRTRRHGVRYAKNVPIMSMKNWRWSVGMSG